MGQGSRRWILASVVLAVASSALPARAIAQETVWCVGERERDPWSECGAVEACSNTTDFETVAEAMAAASAVPDAAETTHRICVGAAQLEPTRRRVVVDLVANPVGTNVIVWFVTENREMTLCPEPGSPPTSAMIELVADPTAKIVNLEIQGLRSSAEQCGGERRRALSITDASVLVQDARLNDVGTPAIEVLEVGSQPFVQVFGSRIDGLTGTAIRGAGALTLGGTEISNSAPTAGEPVIEWQGNVAMGASALFGNVVVGAPLLRSVGTLDLHSSIVAGNVAIGAPLLRLDAFALRPAFHGIRDSVLSRNTLLSEGVAVPLAAPPRPVRAFDGEEHCLPSGADGVRYSARQTPAWTGTPGGTLVELVAQDPDPHFSIVKSYLVENELGGDSIGAFVRAPSDPDVTLTLLHNLVAGSGALFASPEAPAHRLIGARNVFRGPQPSIPAALGHVELTFDSIESAGGYSAAQFLSGLVGPVHPAPPFEALPVDDALALSSCVQVELHCPDLLGDCTRDTDQTVICALDAAVAHVPSASWLAAAAAPFPWASDFFDDATAPESALIPGPVGWTCDEDIELPYDRDEGTQGLPRGDADGYTTLIDCDNEDATIIPLLPPAIAAGATTCEDADGVCFLCPAPVELPAHLVACGSRGCGTPILPAALVLLFPMGLRRTHRSVAPS